MPGMIDPKTFLFVDEEKKVNRIIGNYKLIEFIAEGGCGYVFRAIHIPLDKEVALKALKVELFLKSENVDDFIKEMRTIAALQYHKIVTATDSGTFKYHSFLDVPYFVMPFIPGGSLKARHKKGSKLPPRLVNGYVAEISQALYYAHNHHIIHRDVKPANILIDSEGGLILSDFGAAIQNPDTVSLALQENFKGTWEYSAPEQFTGHAVRQSDQYALGIMVYEWLTGHLPFSISDTGAYYFEHLEKDPPPFSNWGVTYPEIEKVVRKALNKKPVDRYPSVLAFSEAFSDAVEKDTSTPDRPSFHGFNDALTTFDTNYPQVQIMAHEDDDQEKEITTDKSGIPDGEFEEEEHTSTMNTPLFKLLYEPVNDRYQKFLDYPWNNFLFPLGIGFLSGGILFFWRILGLGAWAYVTSIVVSLGLYWAIVLYKDVEHHKNRTVPNGKYEVLTPAKLALMIFMTLLGLTLCTILLWIGTFVGIAGLLATILLWLGMVVQEALGTLSLFLAGKNSRRRQRKKDRQRTLMISRRY